MTAADGLEGRCDLLRALHRPGVPVVLPNAWDAATAKAVAAAGFPAVATTSAGVAAALGYDDHEGAPVGELKGMGVAGCNLEDSSHAAQTLRDPVQQAAWLRNVRQAASDQGYRLVINARIDVFLPSAVPGSGGPAQGELMPEALRRAQAYLDAGADCVFPIGLWEAGALAAFVSKCPGPVNVLRFPQAPSLVELAELGVARVSYGGLLHRGVMEQFSRVLASLTAEREHLGTG